MFTLTTEKIRAFSEVSRDIGQVFFASMIIEPIVSSHTNFIIVLVGAGFSFLGFGINILFSDYKL